MIARATATSRGRVSTTWRIAVPLILLLVAGCENSRPSAETQPDSQTRTPEPGVSEDERDGIDETPNERESDGTGVQTTAIIEKANRAVVYVVGLDANSNEVATGSGVVIDSSGLVATNYHVLTSAVAAYVQFRDGRKYDVQGYRVFDPQVDLVVLQLKSPPADLDSYQLREPKQLRQGDELRAIGHPAGFDFTISRGIVSAVRETSQLPSQYQAKLKAADDTVWIQTDAAVSGGSSGGPLLDRTGQILGVTTWIAQDKIGFAVHVKHLIDVLARASDDSTSLPYPDLGLVTNASVAEVIDRYKKEHPVFLRLLRDAGSLKELSGLLQEENPGRRNIEQLLDIAGDSADDRSAAEAVWKACELLADRRAQDDLDQNVVQAHFLRLADDEIRRRSAARGIRRNTRTNMKLVSRIVRQSVQEAWTAIQPVRDAADLSNDEHLVERVIAELERHDSSRQMGEISYAIAPLTSDRVSEFLQHLISSSPHREVRGLAYYSLAWHLRSASAVRGDHTPEVLALLDRVTAEFGDVRWRDVPLRDLSERAKQAWGHTAVGQTALEISGDDLDGEEMKLSDFRGNVVLLDFWADWCIHCRRMYAHEREIVERYQDQPFVVLGVNCDETRTRARRLVEKKEVTWRSWFDGQDATIRDEWGVSSFPSIYVLDKTGTIRFKDVRDKELDEAIEQLLTEDELRFRGNLLAKGASWSYVDDRAVEGPFFIPSFFSGTEWKTGPAPLGYGHGDEATELACARVGEHGPKTAYFRTTFQTASKDNIQDLVLSLHYDDGVAVYLNGIEVVRTGLRAKAGPDEYAVSAHAHHGKKAEHFAVPIHLIQRGENVLAAEVHQVSDWSADLRFDASLSSNVVAELRDKLKSSNRFQRLESVRLLGQLRSAAAPSLPQIKRLLRSDDEELQREAFFAFLSIAPAAEKLSVPKALMEKETRKAEAERLRHVSWDVVRDANRSEYDYQTAYRDALAASILEPNDGGVARALGASLLRIGRYKQAMRSLAASAKLQGWNPIDLILAAMAEYNTDDPRRWKDWIRKARALMREPDWKEDEDAKHLLRQARNMMS